jgi:beta-glucosidase/6-phospho-beta-glucosidase/beta-galactosidase
VRISGKGVNIWDTLTHERPYLVFGGANGDVADDSYHLYLEDVNLLKDLGVSH